MKKTRSRNRPFRGEPGRGERTATFSPFRKKRKREVWWGKTPPTRKWGIIRLHNEGLSRFSKIRFSRDSREYRALRQRIWDQGIRDRKGISRAVKAHYIERHHRRLHYWIMQLRSIGVSKEDCGYILAEKEKCPVPRCEKTIRNIIREGIEKGWPGAEEHAHKPRPEWLDNL